MCLSSAQDLTAWLRRNAAAVADGEAALAATLATLLGRLQQQPAKPEEARHAPLADKQRVLQAALQRTALRHCAAGGLSQPEWDRAGAAGGGLLGRLQAAGGGWLA